MFSVRLTWTEAALSSAIGFGPVMNELVVTGLSPGRAEWLGNHTDYNDGLVLGIGLEVGATVRVRSVEKR